MAVRAIRGATTAEENTRESIIGATLELIKAIEDANDLKRADSISIIFTVTKDLTAVFPAAAAREFGLTFVPLLDMQAPDIDGALQKCIRIMIHINTDKTKEEINHVYLRGAKALRPDLVKEK
ncbi:MAG: chorismate mutase [Clostridia bacterium]|nr:chorismate mutase [Clostridia bacterium]MBQ2671103.1 chorismate mutase [Clostridia bacterium]MBQ6558195.1 chorismate mutase [Clostridia bacterium]MBR0088900.1 chorismate mutase [Clostridia bacterium]MBR0470549.1 chorismate mutase [Clostridia bacterium]